MAAGTITITKTPKDLAPGYNPMIYVANTTTAVGTKTNFSFVVDVYLSGSGTKAFRYLQPPDPVTNECIIDIHRVIEKYLTSDIYDTTNTAGSVICSNSLIDYVVEFGEAFDDPTYTIYDGLTVDSSRDAINASLTKQNYLDWDFDDYKTNGLTKKFLTNSTSTLYTSINDYGALYFYKFATLAGYATEYKTYDSAGALIGTYQAAVSNSEDIKYTPANPASINLVTLSSGVQPVIDTNVATYTVQIIQTGTGFDRSEIKTFVIREKCGYDVYSMAFLNALGGFDKFNFYKRSDVTKKIERRTMKTVDFSADGAGGVSESMANFQNKTFYSKTSEEVKVFSDWLTEDQVVWLEELVTSTEVYLQNGAELIAVGSIGNTSYEIKKKINEKLFLLELTFTKSNDNYRQRW